MTDLILYDAECGFCRRSIRWLLSFDRKAHFYFAPLQGEVARQWFQGAPPLDSLILIEEGEGGVRIHRYGKALFRIFWKRGGVGSLIGWLGFLPAFLIDPPYRWFAKRRHLFGQGDSCSLPEKEDRRFLH